MRACLAIFLAVFAPFASAADDVTLSVKPVLCILDEQTTACEMGFIVTWESAEDGYYCLYHHFATAPLRCWQSARRGEHEERRSVDESFQFWLNRDGIDEPVATAAVEVMIAAPADRRRTRRTRHIWDLK